jgi:hypothetical protein
VEILPYSPALHPLVTSLYRSRGLPSLPAQTLTRGKIGVIANRPIAAGFLFIDNKLAWLAFLVTAASATSAERHAALDLIISSLVADAKAAGCSQVVAGLGHPSLIARHKSHGFKVADENITTLIKQL